MARRRIFPGRVIKSPTGAVPPAPSPPVNVLPANTTTNINVGKTFSQANNNPITITDPDSVSVTTRIATAQGNLYVGPTTDAVVKGNGGQSVTLSGSPQGITRALNGLQYVPFAGFSGVATITVTTSDGLVTDIDSFTVTVSGAAPPPPSVGPAPQNNVPGPQSVQSGTNLTFTGASAFSISDTDSTALTTTLTTSNGKLTVGTGGGATISGNASNGVTISGTVAQINAALSSVVYQSNASFVGNATITIKTDDGTSIDTDNVNVNVTVGPSGGTANPVPLAAPFYPPGARTDLVSNKYPNGILASSRPTATMDSQLKQLYVNWRSARVYNVPTVSGAKAVKQTNDPYPNSNNELCTSEGMGMGMLLSVLFNDQATFDGLLKFFRARPAYSVPANAAKSNIYLMDWSIAPDGSSSSNYGGGWPATDGDMYAAQAMAMAWRQWKQSNTTWNYLTESQNTIAAIRGWYFNASGIMFGSSGSDVSRISDYMYHMMRTFAVVGNDTYWTATVIPRAKAIIDKCQTVFSAANGGPGCFVPDAVVNTDGTKSGQAIDQSRITNFAAAFGLGSATYGAGNNNFVPSPGNRLDFTDTEMHHFANSWRCAIWWGQDVLNSNDSGVRAECARLNSFIPGYLNNNPNNCPIGFRLNGGLLGPQGGGLSMGNAYPDRIMVASFMCAALVDPAQQSWVNACYEWLMTNYVTDYYDAEYTLLALMTAAGNFWTYPGVVGSTGGTSANPNAPVNTVPAAQTLATGATKTFSTANSNPITVTDPDSSNLTVTISAAHGTLHAIPSGGGLLADGFPGKVVYGYWPMWGGQALTSVSQSYNVVGLFAARTASAGPNSGNGAVTWQGNQTAAALNPDIQTLRGRGQKVILAIGGSGFGYVYDTRTKSTNLVNSLISIINAMGGLDGIDMNFYEGGIVDNTNKAAVGTELVWIAQQMRAQYGSAFGIISPPGANSLVDQYLMQQLNNNSVLTWCNPQFYDWQGYKAVGYISGLSGGENWNQSWVNALSIAGNTSVGATRVAVGLSANYSYSTSLTLDEANRETDAVLTTYPTTRGVSSWNTELDASGGNAFANNFKQKYGSATSGGAAGASVTSNDSTSVTVAGTISNINAALNGLVYTPTAGYTGADTITVSTTDGTYTDVDTIDLTIGGGTSVPIVPGYSSAVLTQPAGSVSLASYGAVGNGTTNNLTAINNAIAAAAASSSKILWIPAGIYAWTGDVIHCNGVILYGAGPTQSTLHALDYLHSSVWLEGNFPAIKNLKLTGVAAPSRQAAWESTKVTAMGATNFTIDNNWIVGAPAASIQTANAAAHGFITHNTIADSLADSIHVTDRANDIWVENNDISNSGDDGVAVVSYNDQASPCTNVTARWNKVMNNAFGRNMSVVGGQDIYYYDNYIEGNTQYAGLYLAQEGGSPGTRILTRVKAEQNTIKNCGSTSTGHAGIMVFSEGTGPNDDVWLLRNDINQTLNRNGIRYYGPQTNVKLDQNRYTGGGSASLSTASGTTITVNTSYTTGLIGYVQPSTGGGGTTPAPPPPAGSTGQDVLASYFTGGNQGAWLDPQPISAFNTTASSGVALSSYGNFFGRWKDRSGRVHDFVESDDNSRPTATSDGLGLHADIYNRSPIVSAGGSTGAFYFCAALILDPSCYYGNFLSDRSGNFTGIQLGHDSDHTAGSTTPDGDFYVSVGNGSARVIARAMSGAGTYAVLTGAHVLECWWAGSGNNLTVRLDKGTGVKTGVASLSALSAGGANLILGAMDLGNTDPAIAKYFQVVAIKSACPTLAERDLIATWVGSRAGLTI